MKRKSKTQVAIDTVLNAVAPKKKSNKGKKVAVGAAVGGALAAGAALLTKPKDPS